MAKFQKGEKRHVNAGRRIGTPNKVTTKFKEIVEEVFHRMGGVDALLKWIEETPENRKIFYSQIFPRLAPLQLTGADGGAIQIQRIERVVVNPKPVLELTAQEVEKPADVDDSGPSGSRHWAN
jgi:hypothetical protein